MSTPTAQGADYPTQHIRTFSIKSIPDSATLASIYYESGLTKVLCRVRGEMTKDPLLSTRKNCKVKIDVGGDATASQTITNKAENVLSQLIPPETMEKMQILINYEVISLDSSLPDLLINVGTLALASGEVPMRDTLSSITCITTGDGKLILDPTKEQLATSVGGVRLAMSTQKEKLVDFEFTGGVVDPSNQPERLKDMIGLATSGCKALSDKIIADFVSEQK